MTIRKPGLLTAAAIALGLALSPVATFAAAPRAVGQVVQSDAITTVQNEAKKKTPAKKTPPKKTIKKKNVSKPS